MYNFQKDSFPFYRLEEIKRRPDDFKLLERIPLTMDGCKSRLPIVLNDVLEGEICHKLIILDTETTGFDNRKDEIIELALVKVTYSLQRNIIISIDQIYDEFEQPSTKITPEITEITHITNEMVQGKRIDDDMVNFFLSDENSLVVAHNAKFDRPFFEKRFPHLKNLRWACSLNDINWDLLGASGGKKLESLCNVRGWFYNAHRADIDCLAIAWLLYIEQNSLGMLLSNANKKNYTIYVYNSYSVKDSLRARGYKYDGVKQCWYLAVADKMALDEQVSFIDSLPNFGRENIKIVEFDARLRYK